MLDSSIRKAIGPLLERMGGFLARFPVTANQYTAGGFLAALLAGLAIALELYGLGLALILVSRLLDGLDGPVARAKGAPTAFGGYLDSVCDYGFYAVIPLAFALSSPGNAVWAALLLATFLGTGSSFLGFAVLAARRGLDTSAQGKKSFYYSSGLMEGSETVLFFVLFCLLPDRFAVLAGLFAALCILTTILRLRAAWALLQDAEEEAPSPAAF